MILETRHGQNRVIHIDHWLDALSLKAKKQDNKEATRKSDRLYSSFENMNFVLT